MGFCVSLGIRTSAKFFNTEEILTLCKVYQVDVYIELDPLICSHRYSLFSSFPQQQFPVLGKLIPEVPGPVWNKSYPLIEVAERVILLPYHLLL